ncbi:hypothetical protein CL634_10195 [bacterium]|nr:hypothetical protein [bacterium]|tara:strand:+ start:1821 stop:2600 length:780 start_codon:yes stop_codon:yes gene_type:complete
MTKSHTLFKNIHKGEDIWVVCSGPSLDYIDPSFFDGKIVVGVNRVFQHMRCDYSICKDPSGFKLKASTGSKSIDYSDGWHLPVPGEKSPLELITEEDLNGTKILIAEHEYGNDWFGKTEFHLDFYHFSHLPKISPEAPDLKGIQIDSDKLVVSYSTTTSAMHLAAYMGAKNIILCGHDCGTIDGEVNIKNYYVDPNRQMVQPSVHEYAHWIKTDIEGHTRGVKDKLKEVYGVNIHSLNPFINFNLEGHTFEGSPIYAGK